MKIERNAEGDFVLDAEVIASRFGLSAEAMRLHLKRGSVISTVEEGQGEDAGRARLSLRLGNRTWRAVIAPDFSILEEERLWAPSRGRRPR